MVNHEAMRFAMRAYAKTLVVCTTGAVSLSATSTGYARTSGSFIADGFAVGMELIAAGFARTNNNGSKVVTAVGVLTIDVDGGAVIENAAGARSLAVGLPTDRAYENLKFKPTTGRTFVGEQYIPGPSRQATDGPKGEIELTPMYDLLFHVPAETGELAAHRYVDQTLTLFAPRVAIALANGDVLRVRTDTSPFPGQFLPSAFEGFAVMPVSIPFRLRTNNSI